MSEEISYGELIWLYDMEIQDGEKELAETTKKIIKRLYPELVKKE